MKITQKYLVQLVREETVRALQEQQAKPRGGLGGLLDAVYKPTPSAKQRAKWSAECDEYCVERFKRMPPPSGSCAAGTEPHTMCVNSAYHNWLKSQELQKAFGRANAVAKKAGKRAFTFNRGDGPKKYKVW